MRTLALAGTTAAIAAWLIASPAQSAEHEISSNDVQTFFEELRQELTEIVDGADAQRLVELGDRRIAAGASFQVMGTMRRDDERQSIFAASLDRDDLLDARGMGSALELIEDYSLEVEVGDVTVDTPTAATANVSWRDSLTLSHPEGALEADGGEQLSIERTIECTHTVLRTDAGELVLGVSNCSGEARF